MNIIKIQNYKNVLSTTNTVEIKSDYGLGNNNGIMVVLNEDDINDGKFLLNLRGYFIDVLLIPKKYKTGGFSNTNHYDVIKIYLSKNHRISYY
jgi:hypothetical protein